MGFGLTKEHHDFFHQNHFIEFEDLLSPSEVNSLDKAIGCLLPSEEWIHAGHDLWRREEHIQKVTLHKGLGEIASNLSKKSPLRVAYDQLIKGPLFRKPHHMKESAPCNKPQEEPLKQDNCEMLHKRGLKVDNLMKTLPQEPFNLIEASAIRKIVCGLVLQLEPTSIAEEPLVPQKKGSGVFFSPFYPAQLPPDCRLFMIAYTEKIAQYVYEPRDPNLHTLKKLGYAFGDHLRADTHPLIVSKRYIHI